MPLRPVRIYLKRDVARKYFITGFHGVGHVGWIAIRHLLSKLNAERAGYVVSYYMQPFVTVKEGIVLPYEFYVSKDALIFVSNVPMTKRDMNMVSIKVAELVAKLGIEESILIGGLDSMLKKEEGDEFRVAPTTVYYNLYEDLFKEKQYRILEEGLGIVGPLAYFLSIFEAKRKKALAILPYAAIERPDPKAAAKALEVLSELTGIKVETQELVEEGLMIEREIKELEKRMRETLKEKETPPYYI